jgi:hypothetical protein
MPPFSAGRHLQVKIAENTLRRPERTLLSAASMIARLGFVNSNFRQQRIFAKPSGFFRTTGV